MLLLLSTGILVSSPYFLSLFFIPALGVPGLMANAPSMDSTGMFPALLITAVPAHSARRDRGQAVKAAQVGLF